MVCNISENVFIHCVRAIDRTVYGSRLFIDTTYITQQIQHAYRHHHYCANLTDGIAGKTHEQRENSTTKKPHDHQAAYRVFLGGHREKSLRKDNGKHIGVAIAESAMAT